MQHQTIPYVYIFVRKDLSNEQKLVQSCRAVAESAKTHFHKASEHPHFVICEVKNESELLKVYTKAKNSFIECSIFQEADLEDQFTAFATEPVYGEVRKVFKNCQLLKFK